MAKFKIILDIDLHNGDCIPDGTVIEDTLERIQNFITYVNKPIRNFPEDTTVISVGSLLQISAYTCLFLENNYMADGVQLVYRYEGKDYLLGEDPSVIGCPIPDLPHVGFEIAIRVLTIKRGED